MLDLFKSENTPDIGLMHFPEFDYIRRIYLRELETVEKYYHTRVYAIKNNHLLVRLLNQISIPIQYSTDRYVEVANIRAPYIANSLRLTSSISHGNIFNGVFYGEGSREIIISNDEYFNPFEAEKNWERINAINILWHNKSDLGLLLPNGKVSSGNSNEVSIFSINIPLLALQYKCFCQRQLIRMKETSSLLGVAHFIHMYVLPNMMFDQTDIVLMNRLMNLFYQKPMGVPYFRHAFNIVDYGSKVDYILEKVLDKATASSLQYSWLLRSIPCITDGNMEHALQLPDLVPTRQIQWAILLSRLKVIEFLIDVGGTKSINRNLVSIGHLVRLLKRIKNENIYNSVLPPDLAFETEQRIEKITQLI